MRPVFVDFSAEEPRAGNARVSAERAFFGGDHLGLDAGATVTVRFEVPPEGVTDELTLKVRALVSRLGSRPGFAPLDVSVNSAKLLAEFRIPGGGDLPQEVTVAVPAELVTPGGENTLVISSGSGARSHLWLYRVLIEQVWDRDAAERALLDDSFATSLLTYRTELRAAGSDTWQPGPAWRLHIDSGERGLPARLDWRARSGAEASVVFALELYTFCGHFRDAGGQWHELCGELTDRQVFPGDSEAALTHTFTTEASWANSWHQGGPLTFYLSTGDAPFDRVAWADQRGCSASIGLTPDTRSFQGWSQRAGEGPVGYRGTATGPRPAPADPPAATALSENLEDAAQALTNLAGTAVRQVATWLRKQ